MRTFAIVTMLAELPGGAETTPAELLRVPEGALVAADVFTVGGLDTLPCPARLRLTGRAHADALARELHQAPRPPCAPMVAGAAQAAASQIQERNAGAQTHAEPGRVRYFEED